MAAGDFRAERTIEELSHRAYRWIIDRADEFRVGQASGRAKMIAVKRLAGSACWRPRCSAENRMQRSS
jgi:hypothetical protein